jgi:hypothetical protein
LNGKNDFCFRHISIGIILCPMANVRRHSAVVIQRLDPQEPRGPT